MAKSSWNAGIIRPVAVAPTGPFQDGAANATGFCADNRGVL